MSTVFGERKFDISNEDFILAGFRGCKQDEVPWVTSVSGDPGKCNHHEWFGRSALPFPSSVRPDRNNYISISTYRSAADGSLRRGKAYFAGTHVVMIDDIGTKVPVENVRLEPSCAVETSPGNYQAWLFLKQPERHRLKVEVLLKGMISSGLSNDGSDPGMSGVTRYGRLPVGVNGKAKYADSSGRSFMQRVVHWSPELRYSIEQIAAAYGVDFGAQSTQRRPLRSVVRRSYTGLSPESDDITLITLRRADLYIEPLAVMGGGHRIVCPWVKEHTDEDPTGTVYFEPSDENAWSGGFKCHHGHCQHRTIADLRHFVSRVRQLVKE